MRTTTSIPMVMMATANTDLPTIGRRKIRSMTTPLTAAMTTAMSTAT